jgi:hypothetical protein
MKICVAAARMRAWAVASVAVLSLGFLVSVGASFPRRATAAGTTTAPVCRGRAKRLRPGQVGFSFSCEAEDVTAFVVKANRALHSVYDPSFAFGCERDTSRSFVCTDIHSGAGSEGSGIAVVSEPLCHRGAHLTLRVTPSLNFEAQSNPTLTLRGPC